MLRLFACLSGLVCLFSGFLQKGALAEQPSRSVNIVVPRLVLAPPNGAEFAARRRASFAARGSRPNAVVNSSWNGGAGNWNVNSNWTPGSGFPNNGGGNTYNVTIGTGNDTVTLNTNVTISSLTLGSSSGTSLLQNLSGSAETLTDLGALTINSAGQLVFANGSMLTVGSGGTNSGFMDLEQGGKDVITGNFTNSGQIWTNHANQVGSANSFSVSGTLTNNSGAQINLGFFGDTSDT